VRTRSRVAAAQPLLYQCLYLFLRELVPNFTAEWHAMVARILSSLLIPGAVPLIAEIASLKPPTISPRSARVEITSFILKESLPYSHASPNIQKEVFGWHARR
jgi:hypothetical protein